MKTTPYTRDFIVDKADISRFRLTEAKALMDLSLAPGQLLVKVEKFALTANNISYAVTGDKFGYWAYFPTTENGWGIVPVWGYATVIRSTHDEIALGEQLFGYFPMSTHLIMQPKQVKAASFVDQYEHRKGLHQTYNTYSRLRQDPNHIAEFEDLRPGLYGLFATSFLVDDFMADNDFFGARQAILVSASSKTSVSLAYLLNRRPNIHSIGITSEANQPFVKSLGLYDEVITYEQTQALSPDKPALCVDFSGNGELLACIHNLYRDNLKYNCLIGKSHWQEKTISRDGLPGARPKLFWAPAHVAKRVDEWGEVEFNQRLLNNWQSFAKAANSYYRIQKKQGEKAVAEAYTDLVEGRIDPAQTLLCSLS